MRMLWYEHSRGQLMALWRQADRIRSIHMADMAVTARASVAAAIAGAFGGQDTSWFSDLIERMRGADHVIVGVAADDSVLASSGLEPGPRGLDIDAGESF